MVELTVLGSGSSGNCALVGSGRTRLLIDAGLSAKQITLRLAAAGVDPATLDGIILTHEHGDHVRGLDVFCKKFGVPLYCTRLTLEALHYILKAPEAKCWKLIPGAGDFVLGDFAITTFPVPHDAVEPIGLVFRSGGAAVGVVSDVGFVTETMRAHLRDLDAVFVEANYDERLLQEDTRRPWSTKQRIAARHGHLSNSQVAGFLAQAATRRLKHVVLGHLSEDCNQPAIALAEVSAALAGAGFASVRIVCAERQESSRPIRVHPPATRPAATVALAQAELW